MEGYLEGARVMIQLVLRLAEVWLPLIGFGTLFIGFIFLLVILNKDMEQKRRREMERRRRRREVVRNFYEYL